MYKTFIALATSLLVASFPEVRASYSGMATWNDYGTQSGVTCSGYSANNYQGSNIYAAALSDGSPLWTGPKCSGSKDASKCTGTGSCKDCTGPSCAGQGTCGECFNIKCVGSYEGETSGSCTGKTVKFKVVDACPMTHPANYCKTPEFGGTVPDEGACESTSTNHFDLATSAKSLLSSYQYNLKISIDGPVAC